MEVAIQLTRKTAMSPRVMARTISRCSRTCSHAQQTRKRLTRGQVRRTVLSNSCHLGGAPRESLCLDDLLRAAASLRISAARAFASTHGGKTHLHACATIMTSFHLHNIGLFRPRVRLFGGRHLENLNARFRFKFLSRLQKIDFCPKSSRRDSQVVSKIQTTAVKTVVFGIVIIFFFCR